MGSIYVLVSASRNGRRGDCKSRHFLDLGLSEGARDCFHSLQDSGQFAQNSVQLRGRDPAFPSSIGQLQVEL